MAISRNKYVIIQRRLDRVVRVPAWMDGLVSIDTNVVRLDSETVMLSDGRMCKLGESYTRFIGYTDPQ